MTSRLLRHYRAKHLRPLPAMNGFLQAALLLVWATLFTTTQVASAQTAQQIAVQNAAQVSEADLNSLMIYTENYPPLNYEEDGEAKGLSVDLLLEMFARAGIQKQRHEITIVPWTRGYTQALNRPNTILFSAVRSPAREHSFHWIGPIGISRIVLVTRRDKPIDLADGARFNEYKYGVVQHSRGDQALQEAGTHPDQFVYLNSPLSAAHMLARGKVDAWAFERMVAFWVLQDLGYRAQDYEIAYSFQPKQYYFAASLDTDPTLIKALQAALDSIRKDGTLSVIVEAHIPGASGSFLGIEE